VALGSPARSKPFKMLLLFGLLSSAVIACGSDVKDFEGTWTISSLDKTDGCSNSIAGAVAGTMAITQGTGADLQLAIPDWGRVGLAAADCNVQFDVSGSTAAAVRGQQCWKVIKDPTDPDDDTDITVFIESWTFVLADDRQSLTMSATLSGMEYFEGYGLGSSCGQTATATLNSPVR
jgi:hypothetical protein